MSEWFFAIVQRICKLPKKPKTKWNRYSGRHQIKKNCQFQFLIYPSANKKLIHFPKIKVKPPERVPPYTARERAAGINDSKLFPRGYATAKNTCHSNKSFKSAYSIKPAFRLAVSRTRSASSRMSPGSVVFVLRKRKWPFYRCGRRKRFNFIISSPLLSKLGNLMWYMFFNYFFQYVPFLF